MRVEIILDTTDHRDCAVRDEINGWLHHATRNLWTVSETEADDDGNGTVTLLFDFRDPLDASDFRYWRGLQGRGWLA
jgi:hypothetical protein